MKKQIIPTAAFAACLALCAAVWPQKQPDEATPALPTPAAVIATQPEVPEIAEMEEVIPPTLSRSHRLLKRPQRAKYRLPLNRMPHHSKNRSLPRHLTASRTTWSMCQASAG